jgi:hypothetical protein
MQDNSIIHVCRHSALVNGELARYLSTGLALDDVHLTTNGLCCERVVTCVCECDAVCRTILVSSETVSSTCRTVSTKYFYKSKVLRLMFRLRTSCAQHHYCSLYKMTGSTFAKLCAECYCYYNIEYTQLHDG